MNPIKLSLLKYLSSWAKMIDGLIGVLSFNFIKTKLSLNVLIYIKTEMNKEEKLDENI